jgi:hypothetical protein
VSGRALAAAAQALEQCVDRKLSHGAPRLVDGRQINVPGSGQ